MKTMDRHSAIGALFLFTAAILILSLASPVASDQSGRAEPAVLPGGGPLIRTITIHIPGEFRDAPALKLMARDLLFVKEGTPFTPDALEQSLTALGLSERFSAVSVDSRDTGEALDLLFELTPAPLVRDIRMRGIYPYFEQDIRKVMTIGPGSPVTASKLREQEDLIAAFYLREGYIDPRVRAETAGDPREGALSLGITVTRGPYYRLDELVILGNRFFSEGSLRTMTGVSRSRLIPGPAGRFVEENLADDVRNMLQRYRAAGFAECSITSDVHRDPSRSAVSLTLTISEGPRYEVSLEGNRALSRRDLQEDFIFMKEGNRNDASLNRSVRNMMNRYRSRGYPDIRIAMDSETAETDGASVRTVRFVIEEGKRHRVGVITIDGAHSLGEKTVREWLRGGLPEFRQGNTWQASQVDSALFTVTSAYRALGFIDAEAVSDITWRDEQEERIADVTLSITEGVRSMVSHLSFTGLHSVTEEDTLEATELRTGMPLLYHVLEGDRRALAALISEKGRPHVQVLEHLSFSDDRSAAAVEYRAVEGPAVTLGNIYYSGNFRTKERVFRRTLGMRTGDPFSPSRYLQSERNLRNLEILESARFRAIGLAEKVDEVTLLVDVAEKKPYYIEAGFGYESQRGLYADAKAGDGNLLGTNRNAWIGSEVSETGFRTEANLMDPRFLGFSLSAAASLYQERQELFNQAFGTDTYGASLTFARSLTSALSGQLGLRFEEKRLFDRGGGMPAGSEELYSGRSILVAVPALIYDTRDFFIRPRSGLYSTVSVDVSKGVRNSFDDFLKYDVDLRYFRTPLPRVTFALLARAAFLQSFGSSGAIPADQLLFLGGTSTVRGFAENMLRYDAFGNPLGGRASVSGSLEARIDLGRNWELTTFYDTGSVARTFDTFGTDGFRSSVGAGLRYITPIGPMGILYGAKLNRREGEEAGRWHFSIGYTF